VRIEALLAQHVFHAPHVRFCLVEREEGVRAVAAPIFSRGDGRYCVTMSGPMFRFTAEKLPAMIAAVRSTAQRITDELQTTEY
jgi:DNA-binding IclR family transcriptional regulator